MTFSYWEKWKNKKRSGSQESSLLVFMFLTSAPTKDEVCIGAVAFLVLSEKVCVCVCNIVFIKHRHIGETFSRWMHHNWLWVTVMKLSLRSFLFGRHRGAEMQPLQTHWWRPAPFRPWGAGVEGLMCSTWPKGQYLLMTQSNWARLGCPLT